MRKFFSAFALILSLVFSPLIFAKLRVIDATVRLLPPGVPNTSAYFKIENLAETDSYLIGGESAIAEKVELHDHQLQGEVMRMLKQDKVKIGAGQTVHFASGGLHLMLFDLTEPLSEGQSVPIKLTTADGQWVEFEAKVVMPGQESQHSHHH